MGFVLALAHNLLCKNAQSSPHQVVALGRLDILLDWTIVHLEMLTQPEMLLISYKLQDCTREGAAVDVLTLVVTALSASCLMCHLNRIVTGTFHRRAQLSEDIEGSKRASVCNKAVPIPAVGPERATQGQYGLPLPGVSLGRTLICRDTITTIMEMEVGRERRDLGTTLSVGGGSLNEMGNGQ